MKRFVEKTGRVLSRSTVTGRWLRLIGYFAITWVTILVIAPQFQRITMVDTLTSYIEETGIDASALYYTEVEEAAMAELGSKSALHYPPTGP